MANNDVSIDFIEIDSNCRFSEIHVLIVDDDKCDVIALKRMLSQSTKAKYTYTVATTINAAIKCLAEQKYDICLLDYFIGSGNAWAVLNASSHHLHEMPIILVTGLDDEEIDDQLALMGVVDSLSKHGLSRKILERSIRYALHADRQRQQLDHLAHYDSLTGLVNRSSFFDALQDIIARADANSNPNKTTAALFYIDVDFFKQINDQWGHDIGDIVLTCVARRIGASLRKTDTVARIGGDEFALIIEHLSYPECHMIAQKILGSMRDTIKTEGVEVNSSLSIGFALIEDSSLTVTDYIKRADGALYEAKNAGRNTYKVFNGVMAKNHEEALLLSSQFTKALKSNQLKLYFQPIICAQTKALLGVEALLRWPFEGKMLLPDKILPIARRIGAMDILTQWVIKNACEQLSFWVGENPKLVVSINIHVAQLKPSLIETIKKSVHAVDVSARNIQLEINKQDEKPFADEAIVVLNELSQLGVHIAFDNFGENFSSMYTLATLPTDTLKINSSFISKPGASRQSQNFLRAAIHFARELGIDVVAEGIETLAQQETFQEMGANELQGYLYSKPMDQKQCSQYLSKKLH